MTHRYYILSIVFALTSLMMWAQDEIASITQRGDALFEQSNEQWNRGEYESSIVSLRQSLATYKLINNGCNLNYVNVNRWMAERLISMKRNEEAIEALDIALQSWKLLGTQPDNALNLILQIYTSLYEQQGNMPMAAQWQQEVVKTARSIFRVNSEEYLTSLYNLGRLQTLADDYASSCRTLASFIDLNNEFEVMDEDNPTYINALYYYGLSLFGLNDINAEEFFVEAERLMEGKKDFEELRISTLNLLTAIAVSAKNQEKARQYNLKATELQHQYEIEHPSSTSMLEAYNKAAVVEMYDPSKASSLFSEIIEHYKTENRAIDDIYFSAIMGKVRNEFALKHYPQAHLFMAQADQLVKDRPLTNEQDKLSYLSTKIVCKTAVGSFETMETDCAEMSKLVTTPLLQNFPKLSEDERYVFWHRTYKWYTSILPEALCRYNTSQSLARLTYDAMLQSRGILLNSAINIDRIIAHSNDELLITLQQQRNYARQQLVETEDAQWAQTLTKLEKRILDELPVYGDFMSDISINTDSVKQHLRRGDIAIEFVAVEHMESDDTTYMALTLKSEYEYPHVIILGDTHQIHALMDLPDFAGLSGGLYKFVWQPLDDELNGVKRIFFSADGRFYNYPIEYCSIPDNLMVMRRWECYRLSSTREIAKSSYVGSKLTHVALFGDVDYNATEEIVSRASQSISLPPTTIPGQKRDNIDLERGVVSLFKELPGACDEIDAIDKSLKKHHITPQVYKRELASEETVKRVSSSRLQILHFSTHGFYYNPVKGRKLNNLQFLNSSTTNEDNILRRSALVMAGANCTLLGKNVDDDGFLTAQEVADMDLQGVDLAVLSACETGLGQIGSDGVFGLQRGFKKAGVHSILMSLNKVYDHSTMLFMTEFYRSLLSGKSKRQSLIEAQDYVRKAEGGKWNKPECWAPFILLDDINNKIK